MLQAFSTWLGGLTQQFSTWLGGLTQQAASFLGYLTGAGIGLIAILIGALFNAHLNRRRDDRLRRNDARAVATALKAELSNVSAALLRNAEDAGNKRAGADEGFLVQDISQSVRIMPEVLEKISLLPVETIRAVLDAYALLEQKFPLLFLLGGKLDHKMAGDRRVIWIPGDRAKDLAKVFRQMNTTVQEAVAALDAFLLSTR